GVPHRYFIPLMPVSLFFIFRFLDRSLSIISTRYRATSIACFLFLILSVSHYWTSGYGYARDLASRITPPVPENVLYVRHEEFQKLITEHRGQLKAGDVIATLLQDVVRHLVPEYVAVINVLLTADANKLYAHLLARGVTYLYIDKAVGTLRYVM